MNAGEGDIDRSLFGRLGGLGSVTVKCFKARREKLPAAKTQDALSGKIAPQPLLQDGKISEKTLKGQALSHQVGYVAHLVPQASRLSDTRLDVGREHRQHRAVMERSGSGVQ